MMPPSAFDLEVLNGSRLAITAIDFKVSLPCHRFITFINASRLSRPPGTTRRLSATTLRGLCPGRKGRTRCEYVVEGVAIPSRTVLKEPELVL